jgi:serine kinase of HPr protein (carbohydrate metabolism regulator)
MAETRIPEVSAETLPVACVAVDGKAVLIESRSAAQRDDLALCLIDRGAVLVAGGPTICRRQGTVLAASAPDDRSGEWTVAGLGTLAVETVQRMPVALLVTIADPDPRFPEVILSRRIAGVDVPLLAFADVSPATPIRVERALRQAAP